MFDVSKLSPSPWVVDGCCVYQGTIDGRIVSLFTDKEDAAFISLARAAFEVMMRRGWSPQKSPLEGEGWRVDTDDGENFFYGKNTRREKDYPGNPAHWIDPYTALVEADAWYSLHVDCHQGKT